MEDLTALTFALETVTVVLGSQGSLSCAKLAFKGDGLYEKDLPEANTLMQ